MCLNPGKPVRRIGPDMFLLFLYSDRIVMSSWNGYYSANIPRDDVPNKVALPVQGTSGLVA